MKTKHRGQIVMKVAFDEVSNKWVMFYPDRVYDQGDHTGRWGQSTMESDDLDSMIGFAFKKIQEWKDSVHPVVVPEEETDDYKRYVELGWKLIEWKMAYYHPNWLHPSWKDEMNVEDAVYDQHEDEYRKLCKKLGKEPTACDMVGFDETRPSCRLVMQLLRAPRKKK